MMMVGTFSKQIFKLYVLDLITHVPKLSYHHRDSQEFARKSSHVYRAIPFLLLDAKVGTDQPSNAVLRLASVWPRKADSH